MVYLLKTKKIFKLALCIILSTSLALSLFPAKAYAEVVQKDNRMNDNPGDSILGNIDESDTNKDQPNIVDPDEALMSSVTIGCGTADDPYIIYSEDSFITLMNNFSITQNHACFKLNCDITIDAAKYLIDGNGKPTKCAFNGRLDGCGHKITKINNSYYDLDFWWGDGGGYKDLKGALFSCLEDGAEIKNLDIETNFESFENEIAILTDEISGKVLVDNCRFFGSAKCVKSDDAFDTVFNPLYDLYWIIDIIKSEFYCGSLVAYVNESADLTVLNSTNYATLTMDNNRNKNLGGFIGYSKNAKIQMENCTNEEGADLSAVGAVSQEFNVFFILGNFIANLMVGKFLSEKADLGKIARCKADKKLLKKIKNDVSFNKYIMNVNESLKNFDDCMVNLAANDKFLKAWKEMDICQKYAIYQESMKFVNVDPFSQKFIEELKNTKREMASATTIEGFDKAYNRYKDLCNSCTFETISNSRFNKVDVNFSSVMKNRLEHFIDTEHIQKFFTIDKDNNFNPFVLFCTKPLYYDFKNSSFTFNRVFNILNSEESITRYATYNANDSLILDSYGNEIYKHEKDFSKAKLENPDILSEWQPPVKIKFKSHDKTGFTNKELSDVFNDPRIMNALDNAGKDLKDGVYINFAGHNNNNLFTSFYDVLYDKFSNIIDNSEFSLIDDKDLEFRKFIIENNDDLRSLYLSSIYDEYDSAKKTYINDAKININNDININNNNNIINDNNNWFNYYKKAENLNSNGRLKTILFDEDLGSNAEYLKNYQQFSLGCFERYKEKLKSYFSSNGFDLSDIDVHSFSLYLADNNILNSRNAVWFPGVLDAVFSNCVQKGDMKDFYNLLNEEPYSKLLKNLHINNFGDLPHGFSTTLEDTHRIGSYDYLNLENLGLEKKFNPIKKSVSLNGSGIIERAKSNDVNFFDDFFTEPHLNNNWDYPILSPNNDDFINKVTKKVKSSFCLEQAGLVDISDSIVSGKNVFRKKIKKSLLLAADVIEDYLDNLSSACASLTGGDDSTDIHYNAYAGGLIGYYSGDNDKNSKVKIIDSHNRGGCSGGHAAGGLVAYIADADLDVEMSDNYGLVSCSDYACWPSSGGILGQYASCSDGRYAKIKSSLNFGYVISRDVAGGIVGRVNDGDLDFIVENSGSVGGVAGEDYVGGILGFEDSVKSFSVINSYTCCEFDTTTLTETRLAFSKIPLIGMDDWIIQPTSETMDGESKAGAIVGKLDDIESVHFDNCYYKSGNDSVGNSQTEELLQADIDSQLIECSINQFRNGAVTYSLNKNYDCDNFIFGQCIDKFDGDVNNKQWIPVPCGDKYVYKDLIREEEIYTNYNPRTIELHFVSFNSNHATVAPDVIKQTARHGEDFSFNVSPDEGYEVKTVTVKKSGIADDEGFVLQPYFSNDEYSSYVINNLDQDLSVNVYCEESGVSKPEGLGTQNQPYLVWDVANLKWLNNYMNGMCCTDVYIKLQADIDWGGFDWQPLCSSFGGLGFSGVFDGCGHTIKNLVCDSQVDNGFFGSINEGSVVNLNIEGKFKGAVLAYFANNAKIENCSVSGSVNSNDYTCGGLVAIAGNNTTIYKCINNADICVNSSVSEEGASVGGIAGLVSGRDYMYRDSDELDDILKEDHNSDTDFAAKIQHCKNNGHIKFSSHKLCYSGGIVGRCGCYKGWTSKTPSYKLIMDYCENNGYVVCDEDCGSIGGGLLGGCGSTSCYLDASISNCMNNANIGKDDKNENSKLKYSGGFLGTTGPWDENKYYFRNCINKGFVYSFNGYAGSALGIYGDPSYDYINIVIDTTFETPLFELENCALIGDTKSQESKYGEVIGAYDLNRRFGSTNIVTKNLYLRNIEEIDQVGGKAWLGGNFLSDIHAIDFDLSKTGYLAYELEKYSEENLYKYNDNNEHNGIFSQKIEPFTDRDLEILPRIFDYDFEDASNYKKVYKNDGSYTQDMPYVNSCISSDKDDKYFNINIKKIGSGNVYGQCRVKAGNSATFQLCPLNGFSVESVIKINEPENNIYNGQNVCQIDNVQEDINLTVKFNYLQEFSEFDKESNTAFISNLNQLNNYAEKINSGQKINAKLTNNIKIESDFKLISIGLNDGYSYVFDGQGYTIFNESPKILFENVEGGIITNLNVCINQFGDYVSSALIRNAKEVTIDNTTLQGVIANDGFTNSGIKASSFGGFIYSIPQDAKDINISNCTSNINVQISDQDIMNDYISVGAFVSVMSGGNLNVVDCENDGNLSVVKMNDHDCYVSALIGFVTKNANSVCVEGFVNKGILNSYNAAAGVIAMIDSVENHFSINIRFSTNQATIYAVQYAAGFVANIMDAKKDNDGNSSEINFLACQNTGDINLYHIDKSYCGGLRGINAGGFAAHVDTTKVAVSYDTCLNVMDKFGLDKEDSSFSCLNYGGFTAYADAQDYHNSKIHNCFSYIKQPPTQGDFGIFVGSQDDNYSYSDISKMSGDNNSLIASGSNNPSVSHEYTQEEISNGLLAYNLMLIYNQNITNQNIWKDYSSRTTKNNSSSLLPIGQSLDSANNYGQNRPYICGPAVYEVDRDGLTYFSNYDNLSSLAQDKFIVSFNELDGSACCYTNNGSLYDIPNENQLSGNELFKFLFMPEDSRYTLTELSMNGRELDFYQDYNSKYLLLNFKDIVDVFSCKYVENPYLYEQLNMSYDANDYAKTVAYLRAYGLHFDYKTGLFREPQILDRSYDGTCIYKISTSNELLWFTNHVNNSTDAHAVNDSAFIANDIDMSGYDWTPIGYAKDFCGKIIGNGFKISNLSGNFSGFIRHSRNCSVENLQINVNTTNNVFGGCIVYADSCYLNNVSVSGSVQADKLNLFGGIVADAMGSINYDDSTIPCDIANFNSGCRVYNCSSDINLKINNFESIACAAGIVGKIENDSKLKIFQCSSYSNISSNTIANFISDKDDVAAGICAGINSDNVNLCVYKCNNYGEVSGNYASGAIGSLTESVKNLSISLNQVNNFGKIKGAKCGGLVSALNSAKSNVNVSLLNSTNWGEISSFDKNDSKFQCGGLVCLVDDSDILLNCDCCANYGSVQSGRASGGFVGTIDSIKQGSLISNSFAYGNVNSCHGSYEGYFVGDCDDDDIKLNHNFAYSESCSEMCFVGHDSSNDSIDKSNTKVSWAYIYSGYLCYSLNTKSSLYAYNQILDDYSYGQRESFPVILDSGILYQNFINGIRYTSFSCDSYPSVFSHDGRFSNFSYADLIDVDVRWRCDCDLDAGSIKQIDEQITLIGDGGIFGATCVGDNFISKNSNFNFMVKSQSGYCVLGIEWFYNSDPENVYKLDNQQLYYNIENISSDITVNIKFTKYSEPQLVDGYFELANYSNLLWFSEFIAAGNVSARAKLIDNIDCTQYSGISWIPIGNDTYSFQGEILGNDHVIDRLSNENYEKDGNSFIYSAKNAVIKDLRLTNIRFGAASSCAGLINKAYGACDIENVDIDGSIRCAGVSVGGFIADIYSGNADKNATLKNCVSNCNISKAICKSGHVGGFVGYIHNNCNVDMDSLTNNSEVYSNQFEDGFSQTYDDFAAGIVSFIEGSGTHVNISSSENNATVKGNTCAGIVATLCDNCSANSPSSLSISDCNNSAWVCGEYCAGILAKMDDVDSVSDNPGNLSVVRCFNMGLIGMPMGSLSHAGGIIAYVSDSDINAVIDSVINFGPVINGEVNAHSLMALVSCLISFGLDIFGFVDDATDVYFAWLVLKKLGKFAAIILVILEAAAAVLNFVHNAITGRVFMPQYAGGIAGELDSLKHLDFTRSMNLAYVKGQTYDDGVCADFCSKSKRNIKAVYSIGFSNKEDEEASEAKIRTKDMFNSGAVGYEIQEAGNNLPKELSQYKWGQIIDNLDFGTPMGIPLYNSNVVDDSLNYPVIYTNKDINDVVYYSNYKVVNETATSELSLSFSHDGCLSDPSVTQNEDEFDIAGNFETIVSSNMGNRDEMIGQEQNVYTYSVKPFERNEINIKSLSNYTISDVDFDEDCPLLGYSESIYTYSKDGVKSKYFDPVTRNDKDTNELIIISYSVKIDFLTDGSANIHFGICSDKNRGINIRFTENKPVVYQNAKEGMVCTYMPWNRKDSFPEKDCRVYLTDNILLQETSKISGNVDVNFFGKDVKLFNDASICVPESCSLNINDSYNIPGMICRDESDTSSCELLQISGNSKLENITIIKKNEDYCATLTNNPSLNVELNNAYRQIDSNSNGAFVAVNGQDGQGNILFGDSLNFKSSDKNPVCDILFNVQNPNLKFAGDTIPAAPYTVMPGKDIEKINLVNDFKSKLKANYKPEDFFKPFTNNLRLAFSTHNQDAGILCLCDKDCVYDVDIQNLDYGQVWPTGHLSYYMDSDIQLEYASNSYCYMDRIDAWYGNKDQNSNPDFSYLREDLSNSIVITTLPNTKNAYPDLIHLNIKPIFCSYSNIDIIKSGYISWNSTDSLPEFASNSAKPKIYQLENDVDLYGTWEVPSGPIVIDLNGHNIVQHKPSCNIAHLSKDNSMLCIVDSSLSQANQNSQRINYFEFNSKNKQFDLVNNPDLLNMDKYISVKGGMLCGVNEKPSTYYSYKQSAGAVVVDNGTFIFGSGNICGNNSSGLNGGSGITVGENGCAQIGKDARICCNTISGDPDYLSSYFSAGIATKGITDNNGMIDNNVALSYAASALTVLGGKATNSGTICNNKSYAENGMEGFSAVVNSATLLNSGSIKDNYCDFACSGVVNSGLIQIKDGCNISNNQFRIQNIKYICDLEQQTQQGIEILDKLTQVSQTVLLAELNMPLTKNWIKSFNHSSMFKIFDTDLISSKINTTDSSEKTIAVGQAGELVVAYKSNTINWNFNNVGYQSSLMSDLYVLGCEIYMLPVEKPYKFASINLSWINVYKTNNIWVLQFNTSDMFEYRKYFNTINATLKFTKE